jgi:hypothetical protein
MPLYKMNLLRTSICLLLLLVVSSCRKQAEPITIGNYYINNLSGDKLRVEAVQNGVSLPLLADTIPSLSLTKFYTAVEATGGNVLPSNFFTELNVYRITPAGDSLVHSGVNNADWKQDFHSSGEQKLVLDINL